MYKDSLGELVDAEGIVCVYFVNTNLWRRHEHF